MGQIHNRHVEPHAGVGELSGAERVGDCWVQSLLVQKGPDLGALDLVLRSWSPFAFREKPLDVLK